MRESVNIKIGGLQGEGVDKTGIILSKYLTRLGLATFSYREYRSVIKGGHTTYQIHASSNQVYSQIKKVDLLIALDKKTVSWHQDELDNNSLIIHDPDDFELDKKDLTGIYLPIPLLKITKQAGGIPLMANMTASGCVVALLDLPLEALFEQIKYIFGKKGEKIVKSNKKVAQAGYDYFKKEFEKHVLGLKTPKEKKEQIVLFGNEAIAAGAVAGGLQLYSAYPMTPSSSILHYLAAYAKKNNLVVKHTEDEISAINMAIGASFTGVRAMTGTSGGGFCLMTEGLGLAGVSETPVVVINSQRPGPALGMPTWTAQSDLQFAIQASQDEFLRIVLAPGNPAEAFELTKLALILAEKYQLPVILLVDKYISESITTCSTFKAVHKHKRHAFENTPKSPYLRYKVIKGGVSPRTIPGQVNGTHICNSYEHSEDSFGTEELEDRNKQMDKRASKLKSLLVEIPIQEVYGKKEARIGIISWGSSLGPIREALKNLSDVKALNLSWLWPFPRKQIKDFLGSCDKALLIEGNSQAQLGNLIKQELQINIKDKLLKYDGRPFWPNEIISKVRAL